MEPQEFIQDHGIKNGQVVVIAGETGSGKTQISEWLGVGLAHMDPNRWVGFVNRELPFSPWKSRMHCLKAPSNVLHSCATLPDFLNFRSHMVWDNPLLSPAFQRDPGTYMEHAKSYAKSHGVMVIVTAQLSRKQSAKLHLEKWLSPDELPSWMRTHTDELFFTFREGDRFQILTGMHNGRVNTVVNRYGVVINEHGIAVTE